jgi:hypothetical protein
MGFECNVALTRNEQRGEKASTPPDHAKASSVAAQQRLLRRFGVCGVRLPFPETMRYLFVDRSCPTWRARKNYARLCAKYPEIMKRLGLHESSAL